MLTKTGNSNAESTDVTVEIDPVLSLRLSKDEINLNPNPVPEGTFAYDTLSAIVDTNNKTGYTLTMNSETEEAALAQEDEETKIPSLISDVTVTSENQSNFTMNRWGYSLASALTENNTTFNPIPALSTPDTIAESEGPIAGDTTPVTFATRVDTSLPSGTYNNTITFTATANYVPGKTFSGITTMQEMTGEICNAETTPTKEATEFTHIQSSNTNLIPETTLIDIRDGKTYIVRKLADGNCWMSQDLRLGSDTDTIVLTSENSNLRAGETLELPKYDATYKVINYTDNYYYKSDYTDGYYYDMNFATNPTTMSGIDEHYEYYIDHGNTSICPKGWAVPSENIYEHLVTSYDMKSYTELLKSPLDFKLAGFYYTGYQSGAWENAGFRLGNILGIYATNDLSSGASTMVGPLVFGEAVKKEKENGIAYIGSGYNLYSDFGNWIWNKDRIPIRCVARAPQQIVHFDGDGVESAVTSVSVDLGSDLDIRAVTNGFFKKDGYTLKQWRDQDGNLYDAQSDPINVNPGNKPEITLTAVWSPNFFRSSLTTMQGMTNYICSEVATPSKDATTIVTSASDYTDPSTQVPQVTLKDTRDNNTYTVKKLADGNCWMTQNLRLVGSRTLTSADSDVSSNFSLPSPVSTFTNSSNNNQVGPVQSSYGNGAYYSWYTATAGTGTAAMSTNGQDATSSICPKGWRLPPYSGNKSYQNLLFTTYGATNSAAGYNILVAQPLQFVLAGYYYTSGFRDGGSGGNYWSSSVYYASYAYFLYFSSSGVDPQGYYYEYFGRSVRCVAR